MSRRLRHKDYTVGWVCALPIELAAAQEMLDEEHEDLERDFDDNDDNLYALGSIGGHNVVIVCLPAGRIGNNPAAAVAMQMKATFKSIKLRLMVGIGGGVPSENADVRLGDIIVSQPHETFNGVVQYDMGKATPSGFKRTGSLNSSPQILLAAVAKVRANEIRGRSGLPKHLLKLGSVPKFQRSKTGSDALFDAAYDHAGGPTCDLCSADRHTPRQQRESGEDVVVHYGTIASGNQVMRNATERDRVSTELGGVLCFEMEAAGLMNTFSCLVIRGICDYADSHKNKKWQAYAAGTAAAWAKEVLLMVPPAQVAQISTEELATGTNEQVPTPIYYIPFPKNTYFVGRKDELDVLKQRLMVKRDCQKMSVVGLGGTGKTQVALQFAYTVKEEWPDYSILWMPALSLETYEQTCTEIVKLLPIKRTSGEKEDAKELVRQYFSSARAGRWLLVLDNADDKHLLFDRKPSGIVDYLPKSTEGVVVYTTRVQDVAVALARSDVLELVAMDRADAAGFLEKSLIKKDLLHNEATSNELLDELACLPLAIAQAAAYLNKNKTSITKYLHLLRNTEQDLVALMSREFRDDTRYESSANAVATTWVVSFCQIQMHDAVAASLLSFISCIEWRAIPLSLLPNSGTDQHLDEAIGTLRGYSFLTRRQDDDCEDKKNKEEYFDMHRLVHLATKIWTRQHGDTANMRQTIIQHVAHVADVFPTTSEYENQAKWRAYLPHALQLLGTLQDRDDDERAELCLLVGQCLLEEGRIQEAVRWLEDCCQSRGRLNDEDPVRLRAQHSLAIIYWYDGQMKKAVELLEHVVAVEGKWLVGEDPYRLASQHTLAGAYVANGQVKKAVELLEHLVAVEGKWLVKEDPRRLKSQYGLAGAYKADGQVRKAVELLEYVVATQEKVLAEEDPRRLASQRMLGRVYTADGQVRKAVELLEHVVLVEEKLAEEHLNRLASQHLLAEAYYQVGKVEKAIKLLEHVVAVRERVLAEDHLRRLASQHLLAEVYYKDGKVEKAIKLLEHVVAVKERVLAEDHLGRLASQHELARAYCKVGKVERAIKLLEHVVSVEEKLAEEQPNRLASQHLLAGAYCKVGKVERAIKLMKHVVAVRARVLRDDHPKRLEAIEVLEDMLAGYTLKSDSS